MKVRREFSIFFPLPTKKIKQRRREWERKEIIRVKVHVISGSHSPGFGKSFNCLFIDKYFDRSLPF